MNFLNKTGICILSCLLCLSIYSTAQRNSITHVIISGDNLSSLARQYHTTTAEILKLNNLKATAVLRIGQPIKVPAAAHTVTSPVPKAVVLDKNLHLVQAGESLSKIARENQVTIEQLKEWNNLQDDKIRIGQALVIAKTGTTKTVKDVKPKTPTTAGPSVPVIVKDPKPDVITKHEQPIKATNPEPPVVKAPEPKVETETTIKTEPVKPSVPVPADAPKTGYFTAAYIKGTSEIGGSASTFKTASGWVDKKYYVLLNNVDAGTIVKIGSNRKTIYAKVLGPLPAIKEDDGLLLRMSSSAANALGVGDNIFAVTVNF